MGAKSYQTLIHALIKEYLTNAHKDIYETKQFRFVISDYEDNALGLIDLFDLILKTRELA